MAWHSIAWHGMARDGMARHSMAWHGMAWHSIARHSTEPPRAVSASRGRARKQQRSAGAVRRLLRPSVPPSFPPAATAMASVAECLREWEELQDGFQRIQDNHKLYKQKLEELTKLQDGISSCITRQKKRLKELSLSLKKCKTHVSPEQRESIQEIQSLIKERQNVFFEMEAYLPKKNGLYLSLVLGNVNVTLLSKQAKFAYKDEYEKFKLYLTIILLIVSFSCRFLLNSRVTDSAFNFLLVWYYCTLTIRESILINNGSKIKGWWVFHHYISTFLSGVMLTWPDGLMYQMFRNQFLSFSMYQSFVQFLQYYYQSGCLYRLRALGERHNMDLTVEGFQSWMWRGLTFLLPFLFFGQFWQLYNAVTLFRMLQHPECKEWQVLMCGLPFFVLFLGNFFTTLRVVHQKFQNQSKDTKRN
uniref:Transmembrane protein 120A n=1 Tax=Chrysolophus pictus TaxID=9089 RepID=A0A8C3L3N7_CHRPC